MDRNATVPEGGLPPEYVFRLWNLVIRPPRACYSRSQLGPNDFTVGGVRAHRHDVELRSARGTKLACSHFVPVSDQKGRELQQRRPVIVYLHGNSSNRLEAGSLVGALMAQGISLFCYDAAGCGLSGGDYVSLGWHERDDLELVLAYLRRSPSCGRIGLWGRSMGAVTALMYLERDPDVDAVCLDSPFASLKKLAEELAQSERVGFPLPLWLVTAALALVRIRVKALADFDMEDIVPLDHARKSKAPAIFLHARQDTFVLPAHSRKLYNAYAGDKELVTVDGDHNSQRSEQVINHAVGFFKRAFRLTDLQPAPEPVQEPPRAAPWAAPPPAARNLSHVAPPPRPGSWLPPELERKQRLFGSYQPPLLSRAALGGA